MISKEDVDQVVKHIEKRVIDKVAILMEGANSSDEQKIISKITSEILETIRHT
jgi:hypothetical protein